MIIRMINYSYHNSLLKVTDDGHGYDILFSVFSNVIVFTACRYNKISFTLTGLGEKCSADRNTRLATISRL